MTRKKSGFTLVEILIVVIIMAVLAGVAGSLLAGFYNMFDATTDSATAKRRANDVFNILKAPVLNAGVGMPGSNLGVYFEAGFGSPSNPLREWALPVEIVSNDSRVEGNALKIAYALPTGIKNGDDEIDDFSVPSTGTVDAIDRGPVTLTATASFTDANPATRIVANRHDARSFITFPGMNMRPMFVENINDDELTLYGKVPQGEGTKNIFSNVISPYHDIYAVRAGVACVVDDGASSSFYLFDVCTEDPLESATLDTQGNPGFRVEGVRAVSFDIDPHYRLITVWVLAEGDVAKGGRNMDAAAAQKIRDRWEPLVGSGALNDQVYYEDFRMTWRIRNVQSR